MELLPILSHCHFCPPMVSSHKESNTCAYNLETKKLRPCSTSFLRLFPGLGARPIPSTTFIACRTSGSIFGEGLNKEMNRNGTLVQYFSYRLIIWLLASGQSDSREWLNSKQFIKNTHNLIRKLDRIILVN